MSGEMDWSPNYCLNCDRQTSEPHYCSQSCRLADLEKSTYSNPVTPTLNYSSSSSSASTASSTPYTSLSFSVTTASRNIQVQLAPSFNFAAYRQSSASSSSYSPPSSPGFRRSNYAVARHHATQPPAPALQRSNTEHYGARARTLYSSPSRSSLSSVGSTSTNGMSDQALSELQKYSNAFDHMRDYKRRVTLG